MADLFIPDFEVLVLVLGGWAGLVVLTLVIALIFHEKPLVRFWDATMRTYRLLFQKRRVKP